MLQNKEIISTNQISEISEMASTDAQSLTESIPLAKQSLNKPIEPTASETENTSNSNEQNYPYTFYWKEGGEEVFIQGDFTEWKEQILLKVDPKTKFHFIKLFLPKAIYQFKFIVDGVSTLSKDYPHVVNRNRVVNNFIDLEKEALKAFKAKQKVVEKMKREYNSIYPQKSELNLVPPNTPFNYISTFNIDLYSRQSLEAFFRNQKFLDTRENNLLSENNSFNFGFIILI